MDKIAFLSRLQNERDAFELLLNQVGFLRRLTLRGVSGGLTVKDLLAEGLSHEQFLADRLSEILHGETYSPSTTFKAFENFLRDYGCPDYESPLFEKEYAHACIHEAYKNIEFGEIVAQELAIYANIIESLETLDHSQYLDHDLFHRIAEHTYRPYRRAETAIRRWLKQIASEPKSP